MLAILSPAKRLDFDSPLPVADHSQSAFLDEAEQLVERLRACSPDALGRLMAVSNRLSELNADRYRCWKRPFTTGNARAAILAFNGDVYSGLDVHRFDRDDFRYAQQHLRILSGLYGVLRPLDLIQPYRLEMGTPLETDRGRTLYDFWGGAITEALNRVLEQQSTPVLVNLASSEYFRSVHPKSVMGEIVTPQFKDEKNGGYKTISFLAKKARGMMAAYIIRQRIETPEALRDFCAAGYRYSESESTECEPVFLRDEATRNALPQRTS